MTLVKCAMFGSYPAYPDIAGALGYSGADFRPGDFDIFIKNDIARVQLMRSSLKADFDKEAAEGILSGDSLTVVIDLKDGEASSMAWGCDMSTGYVRANAYLDT